jgi:hypothetical protein
VTSSNSITCGFIIRARAIATRCCCPPESWCGKLSRLLLEPNALEQLVRARLGLRARTLANVTRREGEVVDHAQVRKQVELLEDDADVRSNLGDVDTLTRDLLPLEEDPAGVDRLEQVDTAQERALAAAARADDDEHVARRDFQVDPVEHDEVAEALAHLLEPDHRSAEARRLANGPCNLSRQTQPPCLLSQPAEDVTSR